MDSSSFDSFFATPVPEPARVVPPPIAPEIAPPIRSEIAPSIASDVHSAPAAVLAEPPVADQAYARVALEEDSGAENALLTDLLREMVDRRCSDLHITAAAHPTVRLNGHLVPLVERPVLTPAVIQRMLYAIITQRQREKFEEKRLTGVSRDELAALAQVLAPAQEAQAVQRCFEQRG